MNLLTVREAATRLRCNPQTVAVAIRRKELRAAKVAGRWLIDEADLERYVTLGANT